MLVTLSGISFDSPADQEIFTIPVGEFVSVVFPSSCVPVWLCQ